MSDSILIVDDDSELAQITSDMLKSYGYNVTIAGDSTMAFDLLVDNRFQLIILDINLPDGTGFDVCRELRQVSQVPVIFASARTSEDDKVNGLDIGGDDYIAKPYSLKELLSRVNALIRRAYGKRTDAEEYYIRNVDIKVNPVTRHVEKDGEPVKLSLKEFDLLWYMCRHANQVLSKEELLHEVWSAFSEAEISTVAVHIRWLREKLEINPASPSIIQTVWGVGYKLVNE